MALASGARVYTAPKPVQQFAWRLALLPALYAGDGSAILLNPPTCLGSDESRILREAESLPYFDIVRAKRIRLLTFKGLREFVATSPSMGSDSIKVHPWGWNQSLKARLAHTDVPSISLPSDNQLAKWRLLANRATTIPIIREFTDKVPRTFSNSEEALHQIRALVQCVVKLPWSSSGRGVFFVTDTEAAIGIVESSIRRQGSVIIEPLWDKVIDFATEWESTPDGLKFLGLSLFQNSSGGNYRGNIVAPQPELKQIIGQYTDLSELESVITRLKVLLEQYITPCYTGPFGVDMLVDSHGNINPCVEINLRRTMGHVAIHLARTADSPSLFQLPI